MHVAGQNGIRDWSKHGLGADCNDCQGQRLPASCERHQWLCQLSHTLEELPEAQAIPPVVKPVSFAVLKITIRTFFLYNFFSVHKQIDFG